MKKIVKPDVTNEDPRYWEQVLESYGLGEKQFQTEEEKAASAGFDTVPSEEIE